jgi:hypothetical protein
MGICFHTLTRCRQNCTILGHIYNCSGGQVSACLDTANGSQSGVGGRYFFRRNLVLEIIGIEAVDGSAVGFRVRIH